MLTFSIPDAIVGRTGLTTIYGEYGIRGDQSVNPLPVKLVAFTANLIDNQQSSLQWSTSQEFNAVNLSFNALPTK